MSIRHAAHQASLLSVDSIMSAKTAMIAQMWLVMTFCSGNTNATILVISRLQ